MGKIPENQIICGAMPEATKDIPDGSLNCSISSPPYWALRDYGVDGQLGLEPTFEEYIDKLCTIYDEVKRVLRKDGTCWVNLGDTYAHGVPGGGCVFDDGRTDGRVSYEADKVRGREKRATLSANIPVKSLCLIPQRFAIEMVNRGWILRNVIIWHKPNPMPSSAKDRFTVDFEYVYFFVKSKKYWFEPQYEPHTQSSLSRAQYDHTHTGKSVATDGFVQAKYLNELPMQLNPLGRNKRTVWTIPTQPYPDAHFATFPEKLVEPMIKAGCPEFVCTKCGKGRETIFEPTEEYAKKLGKGFTDHKNDSTAGMSQPKQIPNCSAERIKKGYTDCGCNAEWRPGIVLDCFLWKWYIFTGSCKAAA